MNDTTKTFQRLEGFAILAAATAIYFFLGFHWLPYILLLFAFDVSMAGYALNNKVGAFLYNLGHSFIIPAVLITLGILLKLDVAVLVALMWFAHIGMDRALGYGLKKNTGFKHTHLGKIGK